MSAKKSIEESLKEIYENHLPQHLSFILKEHVTKFEQSEKENSLMKEKLDVFHKQKALFDKNTEFSNKLIDMENQLKLKEKSLIDAEIKQQVEKLTYELANEKQKSIFVTSVAMGLVRNIEYRKSIFDNETSINGGHYDANNNYHPPKNTVKNYNETETKE